MLEIKGIHGETLFGGEYRSLSECVAAAVAAGANLAGAWTRDGVRLTRQGMLKFASRSDGHCFMLFDCVDGRPRVLAGCRWFTLPEAREHWHATRRDTPLGEETFDILALFERHVERLAHE